METKVIDFIISKSKMFVIVSIFIAAVIIIFFGLSMGLNYYYGFFIGVLNFIALSIGSDRILDRSSGGGKLGGVFSILRYFAVAGLLVIAIKYLDANVFALVIGLLTIHISLVLSVIPNYLEKRKEG